MKGGMQPPCMSCGGDRYEPPPNGCLDTINHITPEAHQVWVSIRQSDGTWAYEIRGTGVL